ISLSGSRNYLSLEFNAGRSTTLQVTFNRHPRRDHGVWVYDHKLYDDVSWVGKEFCLEVRRQRLRLGSRR
ncbi:MAG: hypothetical protein QW057_09560, partial [Candidatus Bathyarchaeia archaeon]